jgi:hypothetical protein
LIAPAGRLSVLEAIQAAFVLLLPPVTASAFSGFGGVIARW